MFSDRTFIIDSQNEGALISVTPVFEQDGVAYYHVNMDFPRNAVPSKVTVAWREPMVGLLHVGYPCCTGHFLMHQSWCATENRSRFCFGAPMLYTIGPDDKNAATVAVSDPFTPLTIYYYVGDFPLMDVVRYEIVFFDGMTNPMSHYEADIRIDSRDIPYYESVGDVYPWWASLGYEIPEPPAAAEDALYSSWYSYLQMPDQEKLLADLRIASDLGFRTVILDDGWQFEGEPRDGAYNACGDWLVAKDKFPDFKFFVDEIHRLGMKLLVWFNVPFIGIESKAYETFRGKYLSDDGQWGVLDPRYPEARDYIVNTYKRFIRDYEIDGFKLDFIDSFAPGNLTAPFGEGMDTETIDDAVKKLLDEIVFELGEMKEDLLYEYRQNYIGPAINRYGNMLRVGDCAYDALINRLVMIDLRLLHYPVAVHSDMLYWAKEESVELCAKQLLNILFAVPQISVVLAESTEEQKALLRHYLAYWTENREILLHGDFKPFHPEANFPVVTAENEEKEITVLYEDLPFTYHGKAADVFQNTDKAGLVFENPTTDRLSYEIYDCFGKLLEKSEIHGKAFLRLPVPKAGMLRLVPIA